MQMYSLDLRIIRREEGEEILCSKSESQKVILYKRKINFWNIYFPRRFPLVLLLNFVAGKVKHWQVTVW